MTRSKIYAARLVSLALLIAGGATARGQVEIDVIAVTGEFAHGGGGGQFHQFDRPVLNDNGDIAFKATLYPGFRGVTEANQTGIWRKRPHTQVHKIARAGDYTSSFKPYGPQPEVTKARYGTLGVPQIGPDGRVTFLSHLALPSEDSFIGAHNNEMIFTMKELTGGMLDVAQEKGSKAPMIRFDSGGTWEQSIIDAAGKRTWFDQIRPPNVSPDGTISFFGSLQMNGYDGKQGIWFYRKDEGVDPTSINPKFGIIEGNQSLTGGPSGAEFQNFNSMSVHSTDFGEFGITTDFAFHATLDKSYSHHGIYSDDSIWKISIVPDGSPTYLARIAVAGDVAGWGDNAHPSDYLWDELGKPSLGDAGLTVFRATLSLIPGQSGIEHREGIIWLGRYPLALGGDQAAGFPSHIVYDSFDDPLITEDGKIVFCAHLKDTSDPDSPPIDTIYFKEGGNSGSTSIMVRSGTPAPGAGGALFQKLGAPLINERGEIAFSAEVAPTPDTPARFGLWVIPHGGPATLVAISGSPIQLPNGGNRQVQWVEETAINSGGQMSLRIRFEDGTEAVAIASTEPPDPPEFGGWAESQIPDPARRGAGDDPDLDGIPNFLELAFGGDPMTSDPFRSPSATTGKDPATGDPTLELTYFELSNPGDLKYTVEASANVFTWAPTTTVELSRTLQSDGTYLVRIREQNPPAGSSPRFLRVRVTDS